MVKFYKEGIELIRNKIDSEELKAMERLKKLVLQKKEKWDLQN